MSTKLIYSQKQKTKLNSWVTFEGCQTLIDYFETLGGKEVSTYCDIPA